MKTYTYEVGEEIGFVKVERKFLVEIMETMNELRKGYGEQLDMADIAQFEMRQCYERFNDAVNMSEDIYLRLKDGLTNTEIDTEENVETAKTI